MRTGLLYHTGALGDLIVATPAIEYWTAAEHIDRLFMAGLGPHVDLLQACGIISDHWDAGSASFARAYRGTPPKLPETISTVLAFTQPGGPVEHALKSAVTGPVRIVRPVPAKRQPIVEHHLQAIGADTDTARENRPTLRISTAGTPHRAKSIALAPGSGSLRKNWPLERFDRVATTLRQRAPLIWLLGPAEEELRPPAHPDDLILRGLPIVTIAKELSTCALLIGNDSGITHLAAALSVPTVALFATSDAAVWAPASTNTPVTVVTPNMTLRATQCRSLPPPDKDASMQQIDIKPVLKACLHLLR